MDFLKATPELLADYTNFLFDFSRKPVEAIEAKTEQPDGSQPTVSAKLVLYSLLSVGSAIVIVRIGAALGMAEDPSVIVKLLGRFDEKLLPLAALLLSAINRFAAPSPLPPTRPWHSPPGRYRS